MAMRLNNREKRAVSFMTLCIGLFIFVQWVVFPLFDKKERLDRAIQVRTEALAGLMQLQSEYKSLVRQAEMARQRAEKREKGFTLFSFLDRLAGQAGIKDQIAYMKPSTLTSKNGGYKTAQVEMKIQAVTMNRLVPYLQLLESSPNDVTIRRLSIVKTDKPEGFVNAVLQVEAMEI